VIGNVSNTVVTEIDNVSNGFTERWKKCLHRVHREMEKMSPLGSQRDGKMSPLGSQRDENNVSTRFTEMEKMSLPGSQRDGKISTGFREIEKMSPLGSERDGKNVSTGFTER